MHIAGTSGAALCGSLTTPGVNFTATSLASVPAASLCAGCLTHVPAKVVSAATRLRGS